MGYAQDLDIILAAAQILQDREDILFLLAGDGPQQSAIKKQAEEAGLTNIVFHPFIQLERYPDLVRSVDCGLVTLKQSMKTPVVPSKILGYMAAGIPVIGALNPESEAIRIIEDSGGGTAEKIRSAADLAAAISRLADHPDQAKAQGRAGQAYVEEYFARDRCLDEYEKLLLELNI